MRRYNPKEIEPKWRDIWDKNQTYKADLKSTRPKYIAMSMLNYPSGSGIHIGHAMNYTISDVMARFYRQQGYESYHPIGWDAFGLPAENYAIETGISPQASMAKIIPSYHKQYKAMGWSNDWSKEISTHEPEYYKWTQWIFSEMYRHGLAYQDSRPQWWCSIDNTVLADEQVTADGKCWRHDGPNDPLVERREVKQWFFKITDYAEELLAAIDDLDWSESVKSAQRNWIGKSTGALIDFAVDGTKDKIQVFTTRPDTIFGATYLVLAPEHPLTKKLATQQQKAAVDKYIKEAIRKSELERQEGGKQKTGVFSGSYAINPANNEKIPIWIADYVIMSYGTGAIMAVPAHDERDWDFAKKFELPITEVIKRPAKEPEPYCGEGMLINSDKYDGMPTSEAHEKIVADLSGVNPLNPSKREFTKNAETSQDEPVFIQQDGESAVKQDQPFAERQAITALVKHWKDDKYIGLKWKTVDWETLITGGVEAGQTPEEAAIAEIREETGYKNPVLKTDLGTVHAKFFHNPKNENRFAHFSCLYFELADGEREEISELEQKNHEVVWLTKTEMDKFRLPDSQWYIWNQFMGRPGVAQEAVTYRMRDWSVGRQRYWGAPIPIIHCPKCGPQLIPDKDLPVVLPELKDFEPAGDGRSALARATDWLKVPCPKCGGQGERETDTMDTYVDSAWYFLRYLDPANNQKVFDSNVANKWMPIDFYNGADHATAHMLYARFVTRFFTKIGLLDSPEPFKRFLFNGKVTAADGQMFSKSKGNGIDPLEIIDSGYGADALRVYMMFAAPLDQWVRWDPQGVPGAYRFLNRLWNLTLEFSDSKTKDGTPNQAVLRSINKTIKKVTKDIEIQKYNTAIAAMMACVNDFYVQKAESGFSGQAVWQQGLESLVQLVAPFAPYIAEELWQALGRKDSVHKGHWPVWDEKLVIEEKVTIAIQINGKVRGEVEVAADITEAEAIEAAKQTAAKYLAGKQIKKAIYVPGRLVSLVVA